METTKISSVQVSFGDAAVTVHKIRSVAEEGKLYTGKHLPHTHVYYECHVILAGKACIVTETETIELTEGEFVIIPPGRHHNSCQIPNMEDDLVFALTLAVTDGEKGYYTMFLQALNRAGCVPFALRQADAERLLQFSAQMEEDGLRAYCMRKMTAYEILFSLFDTIGSFQLPTEKTDLSAGQEGQNITLDWLVNSYPSLSKIAGELGYTTRHTARLIRHRYGMNLGEMWQKKLLETARKRMERYPEETLNQIAVQAGFPNVDSMKRAFLKWEKTTPAEYREQILSKENRRQ